MKMTFICPDCEKQANYTKDEKLERLGYYLFKCECGEDFLVPTESPLIIKGGSEVR
jgi:hypothetical protein